MSSNKLYKSKISRRDSLKWIGVVSGAAVLPAACSSEDTTNTGNVIASTTTSDWPQLDLAEVTAQGYGKDPKLVNPDAAPWPLTLSDKQLNMLSTLCDILVPAENDVPSAAMVGVPDFVNEWVSAPYSAQQRDRKIILPGLEWLDAESKRRFDTSFVDTSRTDQIAIIDKIAKFESNADDKLKQAMGFFARLRFLVAGAFYSTPEGIKEIGYLGNTPIAGDYPGPTSEAMTHLEGLLDSLGLELPSTT